MKTEQIDLLKMLSLLMESVEKANQYDDLRLRVLSINKNVLDEVKAWREQYQNHRLTEVEVWSALVKAIDTATIRALAS